MGHKKFRIRIDNETRTLNIISSQDVNSRPISTTENNVTTHLISPNHYSAIHTPIRITISHNNYSRYK